MSDLIHQLDALEAGELAATELADLRNRLKRDVALRREYIRVTVMRAHVRYVANMQAKPIAGLPETPVDWAPAKTQHGTSTRITRRQVPRPARVALAAAVLLLGVSLVVLVANLISSGPTPPVDASAPIEPLASVTHVTGGGTVMIGDELAYAGGDFRGRNIALDVGAADVLIAGGVSVTLRGDTHLAVHDKMNSTLSRGEATFDCPPGVEGYTVHLPGGAEIVDLGTRFSCALDAGGDAWIQVIEGAVELRTAGVQITRLDAGLPVQLLNGERTVHKLDRQQVVIENASFESPHTGDEPYLNGATGWEAVTPDTDFGVNHFGGEFHEPVPDGRQLAYLNSGAIAQTTDAKLVANLRYTMSVMIGNRPVQFDLDYTLELWAGDSRLAAAVNPVIPAKGRFALAELVFDCPETHAALGEPIRIVLRSNGSLATQTQNHFDKVRLRAEPFVSERTTTQGTVEKKSHPGDSP